MAVLHGLKVKAADILNAHVAMPNHKKILAVLEPKFGDDTGKSAIIVRALYGMCRCLILGLPCIMYVRIGLLSL